MTGRAAPEEMDLRIDRLANRVLLTSDEGAETWRARVDACSRTGLARALREVLPGVMESVGLGPEAEVVIARLRVRVVVEGEGVSEVDGLFALQREEKALRERKLALLFPNGHPWG